MPNSRPAAPRARRATTLIVLLLAVAACSPTAPSSPSPVAAPSGVSAPSRVPAPSATPASTPGPSGTTTSATEAEVDALREAARSSAAAGTVRLVYTIEFEGATTVPDGLFLRGRGQTSFGDPRQAYLSAEILNESFGDWEMIIEDRRLFLKGEVVSQLVETPRWLLVDLDSEHRMVERFASLASGQNDSSLALLYVLGTTGDVRVGDGGSIDGSATRRYDAEIDLAEAGRRVPPASSEAVAANIAALKAGGISPVLEAQVWVGSAGRIVRARYVYTLGAGEGGGRLIGTYGFSGFGAPMDERTPADEDVVRLEDAVPS